MTMIKNDTTMAGRRLLPMIIDGLAQTDPERIFAKIPRGKTVEEGYDAITIKDLANAVNTAAWWLVDRIDKPGVPYATTLAYVGPNDLRYPIVMLAGVKVGYVTFLPSPRNSHHAYQSLLEQYECQTILTSAGMARAGVLGEIVAERQMTLFDVPDLADWLYPSTSKPYQWSMTFEEGRSAPLVGFQTSGTTGTPKKVLWNHACITSTDAYKRTSTPMFVKEWEGKNVLLTFPFFHAAGIGLLLMGILFNATIILPPTGPSNGQTTVDVIRDQDVTVALLPPSIIVDIAHIPETIDIFSKLKQVLYGGGPLPTDVGNRIAHLTHFVNGYGTSEMGMLPVLPLEHEDWHYFGFPPETGAELREYADGLYELVVVRDDAYADFQSVFVMFPGLDEYHSKDLFAKHPTKEGLWTFAGRTDDILVYSTGEKFNPATFEDAMNGNPAVKAALMVGDARFQSALLIEPTSHNQTDAQLVEILWPQIEKLNIDCPGYAKVMKHLICICKLDKPFPRAAKGTVQRRAALASYQANLDSLYVAAGSSDGPRTNGETRANADEGSIGVFALAEDFRRAALSLGVSGRKIELGENLFDRGLDSLGVLNFVRAVRPLRNKYNFAEDITAKAVYHAKSLLDLAETMLTPRTEGRAAVIVMQELFERYTTDLPVTARPAACIPEKKVVLLTGSTGSLGPYLLHEILGDTSVAKIICLNRSVDAEARTTTSLHDKGLADALEKKSVLFLQADLTKALFGLELKAYRSLLDEVTHVLHNAWQVYFNVSLDQVAQTHVRGVRSLVDFSSRSKCGASIFFVSSEGAVLDFAANKESCMESGEVPEVVFQSWGVAAEIGYAQSKLVAERVLDAAAKISRVPCTICRAGQIAGPTTNKGIWPEREWFPSLIRSSKYLGHLPASLGLQSTIDWVPVDLMARTMVELMVHPLPDAEAAAAQVFHAVNPQRTTWARLLPVLEKLLGTTSVSLADWVATLAASGTHDIINNPAVKLLDFFQNMAKSASEDSEQLQLSVKSAIGASETMARMPAVNDEWMSLWVNQWGLSR